MPHKNGIRIEEEELPGIGLRDDFLTERGRRVGVITFKDGHRELLVYKKGDPDSVAETVTLTESEADILAEYLGTRLVIQRLSRITDKVESLHSETVAVGRQDYLDGMKLGEADIRGRTGAAIVAIWRGKEVIPSPMPNFQVHAGDQLVVIGTDEAIASARAIAAEG